MMQNRVGDSGLISIRSDGWAVGSARATVTLTAAENEVARDLVRTQDLSRGKAARKAIQKSAFSNMAPSSSCDHARELEELRERARALSVARAEWRELAWGLASRQAHPEGRPLARPQAHPMEHRPGRTLAHRSRIHVQTDTGDALRNRSRGARTIRVRRRDGTSYLAQVVD